MSTSNNRIIAKNTIVLSVQMLISLVVGLYTGRIVLATLGVTDYGVYNVVAGVITTLTFLSNALAAGSSRFIIYDLGRGDITALKKTVSNLKTVHYVLAGIVFLIAETLGVWFVSTKLVIPLDRMTAAMWVFQFSVLSFMANIVSAPYNGMLLAHERISIFAIFNMINQILKLLIVYAVMVASFDKLILYAFLVLCVDVGNRIVWGIYCSYHFEEAKCGLSFNKSQFKDVFSFSGWMCIGNLASMCSNQGLNILLNMFFGPIVNAAYGIAIMIQGQTMSFGVQMQVAMRPQIIKSYASSDFDRMQFLIYAGAKFSFYITLVLALPVMMEIHQFLDWWLVEVPEWTVQFVIIIVLCSLIQVVGVSLYGGMLATGKVRKYQITQAIIMLLFLPVSYVVLKMIDASPILPLLLLLLFRMFNELVAAFIALRQLKISVRAYLNKVIVPISCVLLLASIIPFALRFSMKDSLWSFFVICFVSVCCALATSYYIGCNKEEKVMVKNYCSSFVQKFRRHHG